LNLHRSPIRSFLLLALALVGLTFTLGTAPPEPPPPETSPPAGLDVTVTDIRNATGSIRFAVYGDAGSYKESTNHLAKATIPAVEGTLTHHLDLPAQGTVAVLVFHDENDNAELDANLIGIPKEGYGFSNNPSGMGKPGFDEITVEVGEAALAVNIEMKYLL